MKFLNNLKIGLKINLITSLLVGYIVISMSTINYQTQKKEILSELDKNMMAELKDFSNYLHLEIQKNNELTQLGLNLFKDNFNKYGELTISPSEKVAFKAINQDTKEEQLIDVPTWHLAGKKVQFNNYFVDQIVNKNVVAATIFQRIPEGFLRISTSITNTQEERATGTFISNESPVAKAILAGKEFSGRAYVVNDWYLTAYSPIVVNGKIEGMLFVGRPEKDMGELKSHFYEKKIYGRGYPFLVSKDGTLLIHPKDEGKNVSNENFFMKMIANNSNSGKINYTYKGEKKIQYDEYYDEMNAYLAVSVYENDVTAITRKVLVLNLIVASIGIIIFIIFNIYFSRTITNGLKKGVEFAEKLSKGDLSSQINLIQKDEVGALAQSLNSMAEKLRETVEGITLSANSIASASIQMSSTSEELSQSASEQASTVEEVSSTMEEISSTIENNADHAKMTEQISNEAQKSIENVIHDAVNAMESNKLIATKIGIISDIAFQTNILALNAAVEAARAGEHGLGFAVVADEVRRLADTSKLAAQEITKITNDSLKKSELSSQSLTQLLPEIKKTTDLVNEISHSSKQQAIGITQVNEAMQQLNQASQQGAAASEELASSAEELSAQAEILGDLVSFFKVRK